MKEYTENKVHDLIPITLCRQMWQGAIQASDSQSLSRVMRIIVVDGLRLAVCQHGVEFSQVAWVEEFEKPMEACRRLA